VVRITGGIFKGRKLLVPSVPNLRPTTDRVRESLFNILGSQVDGKRVLDLFAGSGALGIEALSRGAAEAIFVERDKRVADVLRKNISVCNFEDRSLVLTMPADKAILTLTRRSERFHLIFMDPPYHSSLASSTLAFIPPLLTDEGIVIVEHDIKEMPLIDENIWVIEDRRRFGRTMVCFLNLRR
jgi:16S rRNA (guanine966-N2)-methyltransferase